MVTAVPVVAVALLVAWLPDLLRPGVARARIRTARVTTGPVDAMIMASGTVVPEIERVLSSPVDARVLRILKRPGARVERGDAVVELDTSESVLALDKLQSNLRVKENEQAERRLTLKTSLADARRQDRRQAARGPVRRGAAGRRQDAGRRGPALARRVPPLGAGPDPGPHRAGAAPGARANAEASTQVALDTLTLERGTLDKEATQARRLVELSTTKSDRAGVVTWALAQEGALVRKGDVIARLADLSSYRVDATVSDVHAGRLHAGHAGRRPGRRGAAGRHRRRRSSRRSRTASSGSPSPSPSRHAPACGPACASTSTSSPTARRGRCASRAARSPTTAPAAPSSSAATARCACRSCSASPASTQVEVVSGAAEGDELIVSDMRDYLHLEQITLK